MLRLKALVPLTVLLLLVSQKSFVDTAPLSDGTKQDSASSVDENVRELENLKKSFGKLGKTMDLIKSQSSEYTSINDEQESRTQNVEEVHENGETLAKVSQNVETVYDKDKPRTKIKTEINVPSEGIHKIIDQTIPDEEKKIESRRSGMSNNILTDENLNEKFGIGGSIRYSPMDVAKYIFWTGDEKGVTLAIEEFLREDLRRLFQMTGEEALAFLQEIKYDLDKLKSHYTQIGLNSVQHSKIPYEATSQLGSNSKAIFYDKPELRSNFNIKQLRKRMDPTQEASMNNPDKATEEDYDEILERLKIADYLYTEYSLEEIIYQLAKVMFTQSLTRGNEEAQQALQKFTNFLETEAEQGHISREIEKRVLDVLIASMSDTLNEHPELLSAAQESMGPTATSGQGHNFVRTVLQSNVDDGGLRELYEYKEKAKNKLADQKGNKLKNYLQFDFSKYKLT
ncbi:unnamed protein product [Phyllotreta striolata]|uniref:Uncharacterized protein n=1 Tax=Phyllotreta striolata TaxID=444603 RepID=A0A9P0DV17_PHYSR|nr:unnamed protein product [Phyllotreta striolata]